MRTLIVTFLIIKAIWATGDHYQPMGRPSMQQPRAGVPPTRQRDQQFAQSPPTQQPPQTNSQRSVPQRPPPPPPMRQQQQLQLSVQVVDSTPMPLQENNMADKQQSIQNHGQNSQQFQQSQSNTKRQDVDYGTEREFQQQSHMNQHMNQQSNMNQRMSQQSHMNMNMNMNQQHRQMDKSGQQKRQDQQERQSPGDDMEQVEERQLVILPGPPQNRFHFPSTTHHSPISQNPLVNVASNFGSSNQGVPGVVVTPSNPSTSSNTGFQGTYNRVPIQAAAQELDLFPLPPAGPKPQILAIDVQCAKESMTVRVEFDQPYNGVIYSKGYFSDPSCRYVSPNSQQTVFEFFIFLNQCGTTFIDQFSTTGHAFLENTLVFQNEAAVQEVWDFARHIRCLWTGLFDKTVTSGINVDMLDVVSVTYSGDTVESYMDIQLGQGPFAQPVTGLVKIGETLTMVIYVLGAENFDIHVKDCIAHDGDIANSIQLTDMRGCVLKKKLMGPWQKTRETGNSGASIIGYSYFQAFRFPDKIEVFFECNIELCKAECQDTCPEYALKRKKRQIHSPSDKISVLRSTNKLVEPVRLLRGIRVVAPEDIAISGDGNSSLALTTTVGAPNPGDLCMSTPGFVTALVITLLILIISCFMTAVLCIRVRNHVSDSSTPGTSQSPYAFRDCISTKLGKA